MRLQRLTIELDCAEDELPHASHIVFENGKWTSNGPVLSRVMGTLHEVWKLIRTQLIHEKA